ncbi:alpha/beta hydrolase [Psychrobium sp. 1_MG-2023]|uniref:alpha/beta hydrolase n=1 Tax=Psychrobium sp. 1_MG-2023 TaxID=3062624 RepID=UPI000C31D51D|nr:alpha/beta hydrolase [Psychrobium sp. 1_MG-2023]MDP2560607.1 alpha/beta hydrolase [Psychrobium sp. 1_MG-2023]PKF57593.1 hypothetical protein CW748_06825 [Alteromonadales bacterium alter-6D02]
MARLLFIGLLLTLTYFSAGAYLLVNQLPAYLFPSTELTVKSTELAQFKVTDPFNNELVVREYGAADGQCIVFFPGRHGGVKRYEQELITPLNNRHFKVFMISYPGQDGAAGHLKSILQLVNLIDNAILSIEVKCSPKRTIFWGRSLGATLAAYTAQRVTVRGLILEGVSPSLSLAVENFLGSKWYLTPLKLLPIAELLPHDYKLQHSFSALNQMPINIFQGTNDLQTPLSQLQQRWRYGENVSLHIVKGGSHSDTYKRSLSEMMAVATQMLSPQ